jgi:hypothetical protein
LLWIVGLAFGRLAGRQRTLRVDVADDGGLAIVWRSPFSVERRHAAPADVFPAAVIEQSTPHGEQHFVGRVILADGTALDIAQSDDRGAVAAVVSRFNAVAGRRYSR